MRVEQPGASAFTELSDVPHTYLGAAEKHLAVNLTETGIDFVPGGGGGGTPGGPNGAVQYNNAGAFAGGELLWDESTNSLNTTDGTVIAVNFRLNSGAFQSILAAATLTSDREIILPDASGIVGLLTSFSVDSSATSGPATYDNATGIFSIPDYISGVPTATWIGLATSWTTEPSFLEEITGGSVYAYTLGATTNYRFVPSPYDATQDAFYTTFVSPDLSGLITTRG